LPTLEVPVKQIAAIGFLAVSAAWVIACSGSDGGSDGTTDTFAADPWEPDAAVGDVEPGNDASEDANSGVGDLPLVDNQPDLGCTGSCEERTCGDDGCGGTCGTCMLGSVCEEGKCVIPCPAIEIEASGAVASWKPAFAVDNPMGTIFYQESTSDDFPLSSIRLEIRQFKPFFGPMEPGTYPFTVSDYGRCGICVSLFDTCTADGCERRYLATSGTLEIEAINGANGPLRAVLKDAVFQEVSIDKDWHTTIFKSRPRRCMADREMASEAVRLAVPEPECVADGTGSLLDDNIADFTLTNCLGNQVSLHDMCGKKKLVWMVLVTGWCPACAQWLPEVVRLAGMYPETLAAWTVIGENSARQPPTQADCVAYAEKRNLDPALTFYDPDWSKVFEYIYPYGFQGIPYNIFLDGDNMSYYWSDGAYGDLADALGYLLNN
jgi:hypothetical protein